MTPWPSSPFARLAPCALVLAACTGTETDNPAQREPPPPYESPVDLAPPSPSPPGVPCPLPSDFGKPTLLPRWGQDGEVVVGAHPYRGLVLLDASTPLAPRLLGELPLDGEAKQLVVEPGLQLSLVIDEVPVGVEPSVLDPRALAPRTRLVRLDASDPAAIERLGAIELEGELWRMDLRGEVLWVMSALGEEVAFPCSRSPFGCPGSWTALVVRAYRFEGGAWQEGQRVELPLTSYAWALPDGYATHEARGDVEGNVALSELHYVAFADDATLGAPVSISVPGSPAAGTPLEVRDGSARLFVIDYETGTSDLVVLPLDRGAELGRIDDVAQQQFSGSAFGAEGAFVGNENGNPALLVDLREPTAPSLRAFPEPFSRVLLLEEGTDGARVLALGQDGDGVRVGLFSAQAGALRLLDETSLPQLELAEAPTTFRVDAERVLFAVRGSADRQRRAAVVTWAADTLAVDAPRLTRFADEVLLIGDVLYAPDDYELLVSAPGEDAQPAIEWTEDVLRLARAGEWEAALVRRLGQSPELRLSRAGTLVSALEVGPAPEALAMDEERVVVLSSLPREQCEQSGLDCSDYEPAVSIVTLGEEPALAATLPLPEQESELSLPNAQRYGEWSSELLALGPGRYVVSATTTSTCTSEQACAMLGIDSVPIEEANVNVAQPGAAPDCPPDADECPPPGPAADPVTVYGGQTVRRFYVLDAAAGTPAFSAPAESVLELEDSLFNQPIVSGGALLMSRIEIEPGMSTSPGGEARLRRGRFMLDRFELDDDGALHALPPVNVPGYPIALLEDGAFALTVEGEAEPVGAATLHLLELADDGARSVEQLALPARYGESRLAFGTLFYLHRAGELCDGITTLTSIALPTGASGELRALGAVEIPGLDYQILDARDERLLLGNHEGQLVVVDVSADPPEVTTFVSLPHWIGDAQLDGDAIVGAAGPFGLTRVSF